MGRRAVAAGMALLALAAGSQLLYDRAAGDAPRRLRGAQLALRDPLLPGVPALKFLALGKDAALGDYLWLQTIQYFGGGTASGKYPALGPTLERITALDPQFAKPYEFAMTALPFLDQAATAARLGELAKRRFPQDGLLRYYLATVYHLNLKKYPEAAAAYAEAADLPGAPGAARSLAATARNQVADEPADRLVAAGYWKTIYERSGDAQEQERARKWYAQLQAVYAIEAGAATYRQATGRYPADFLEMVAAGVIPSLPQPLVGRELRWDAAAGRVDFSRPLPD